MIEFWTLQVVSFLVLLFLLCGLIAYIWCIIEKGLVFILNMTCVEEAMEKELGKDE